MAVPSFRGRANQAELSILPQPRIFIGAQLRAIHCQKEYLP
jgi:hypothetical protein